MPKRILIIGASGSGTTTIGKLLAERLGIPHVETDDLFWIPTEIPFTQFRIQEQLDEMVQEHLLLKENWVLSGSPCGWGDAIIPLLHMAVFLIVPPEIRIERIKERELKRLGDAILPGGSLYQKQQDFLKWTARYDTGGIIGRTKELHKTWLAALSCPVIRFEGETAPAVVVETVIEALKS